MTAERIGSVYEIPRLCRPCGQEFLPTRGTNGLPSEYCSARCRRQAHRHLLASDRSRPKQQPARAVAPKPAPVARPKREPKPQRQPVVRLQPVSGRPVNYAARAHLVPGGSVPREGCGCLACADWRARNQRLPLVSDLERIARQMRVRAYQRGEL